MKVIWAEKQARDFMSISKSIITQWHTREYREEDTILVLDLFDLVYKKRLTKDYWDWLDENPSGKMIRRVAVYNDEIIGYYSICPFKITIEGNIIKSALSVGTMTHPSFTRQGIFTTLAQETYDDAKKIGIKFICGFPNDNSYSGFINKLNWYDICSLNLFEKTLKPMENKHISTTNDIVIEQIHKLTDDFDQFLGNVCSKYTITRSRTRQSLNWRYKSLSVFENYPDREYKIYKINVANNLYGYFILKFYDDGAIKKAHIVDLFISDRSSINLLYNIISHLILLAENEGADIISCWSLKSYDMYNVLKKSDFALKSDTQSFIGFSNCQISDLIKDETNWYVTMGDSDIF